MSSVSQSSVSYSYNPSNLQLDTETITYNLPGQPAFTRVIDRSQDNLNRDTGWQLKNGVTIENEVAYNYGATDGRISSISNPQLSNVSFAYTYAPGSSLVATVTSPVHTVSNVYETHRNVLASKVNKKLDTTTVSAYFYTVNNYGQRTNVTTDGTAFSDTPSWAWGFNSKGEIVKADSSNNAFDRGYQFDGIGNRIESVDGTTTLTGTANYTTNALNQYSSITNPQSTILNPSFDDDGNMTSGPLPANVNANSTLIWDGENRLIEAQVTGGQTVNFIYDAQSRRIAETVGTNTKVTIYDGWNPIAEYTGSVGVPPTLAKTYTWGIDLSGSIQGAGGVGGLLAAIIHNQQSSIFYPLYDGNGNVSEYLNSTGATVAHYEYDPFGKTVVATGSMAYDFAHRFSTKPLDLTTGLYYYGYRYYDPNTGRWPSRDPIEEEGGINLYGFVQNRPTWRVDADGRFDVAGLQEVGKMGEYVFGENWITDFVQDVGAFNDSLGKGLVGMIGKKLSDGSLGNPAIEIYDGVKDLYVTGVDVKTTYEANGSYGLIKYFPNVKQLVENNMTERQSRRAMVNISGEIAVTLTLRKCLPGGITQSLTEGVFPKLSSTVSGYRRYGPRANVVGAEFIEIVNIKGERIFSVADHTFGNPPAKKVHFHLGKNNTQRHKHRPHNGGWKGAWEQFKNSTWNELFGL